ncbi:gibberellin 20-oxidase-like protein [Silene latifolia]|uniref:gibberellin 20-oxidase-like protein n=1 Tax=Silene latifolia TaxID=37657 RepID=UPI003D77FF15
MSQSSQTLLKLPILDISKTPCPSSLPSLLEACKEWGFFHIINHGVSNELYTKLSSFSKQIFSLPLDTKLNLGPSSSNKSYTPQFIASPFYEGLKVSGPDLFSSAECSSNVLFGQNNHEFSETVQEYGDKMTYLANQIIKTLLTILGDDFENKFYKPEFSKCYGYLRIIQYTSPKPSQEQVEGLGKHTDMCCLTILYSDDSSSLQVRSKEGEWMNIEPCEGSLVVNLGDMFEAWSNGMLRSSEHRVMLSKRRNRLCLAFFWSFEDDKVIFAPQEVVGDGNSREFRAFVCSDYVRFREFDDKEKYEKVGHTVRDFAGVGV